MPSITTEPPYAHSGIIGIASSAAVTIARRRPMLFRPRAEEQTADDRAEVSTIVSVLDRARVEVQLLP